MASAVVMAPHLSKKQQQHEPLDNIRRPNVWRFISVNRFGQRARRDSADEGDDIVRHAGPSNTFYDELDGSDSILLDEDGADADSVFSESQYTDAHSNWEHPLTNREDAISFALGEFLQNDAQDTSSNLVPPSSVRHGVYNSGRRQTLSRTPNTSTDAVVNFQELGDQFDAYYARDTLSPFQSPQYMSIDPYTTELAKSPLNGPGHHEPQMRDDLVSSEKGKEATRRPDWGSAANPWALLPSDSPEPDDRQAIMDENKRLRAEIDELKATKYNEKSPETPRSHAPSRIGSRVQSPTARPTSRLQRSRNKKRQDVTLFETTTLRDLVLKRLFTPHVIVDGIIHDEEQPLTLDTPLTPTQVQDFTEIMNNIIVSGSHLKQPIALCAVCHLPKFKGIKTMQQNSYVSQVLSQLPIVSASAFEDFDPTWGTSTCCRRFVCKTCLSAAIISGISTHWWFDLQNREPNWLKCPVPCCGRNLPIYSSNEMGEIMQKLNVHSIIPYVVRFERASELRAALQQLEPLPNKDELRRSKALHDRLIRYRRMGSLFPEEQLEEPLRVECVPVDTADGRETIRIPIFRSLLRNCSPVTCVVCDETYEEFRPGNATDWDKITKGFGGEWKWRIFAFPTPEVLPHCIHDHAICRTCLTKYVMTRVESEGHSVVENINCPTPGCQHKYNHDEIHRIASPETFSLYDRYTVLNSISSQPNFRWCLREGCTAGSLYDDPSTVPTSDSDSVDANCIECSECNFTMCFTCQSPWHADLTCAQRASQREESFTETQTWLEQHTKLCPGESCGVQLQKGDGCFHMTCTRCHFEFCWECLADWRSIFVADEDGGFLRADGHREGCFFRGEGAPLPTQIMGQDLETGLRRLELREEPPDHPEQAVPVVAE